MTSSPVNSRAPGLSETKASDVAPEVIAIAERLLYELAVPHRPKFTPSQLAQDVGGSERGWQRECELGNIGAVRVVGGWIVPWQRLVVYFAQRQNLVNWN